MQDIDSQMHKNLLFLLNYTENNLEDTLGLSFEVEVENFGACFGTEDFKEGTTAFLEKRKAVFQGN